MDSQFSTPQFGEHDIWAQVKKISRSATFKRLGNAKKLLHYLVRGCLEGVPDREMKALVIKADVFPEHKQDSPIAKLIGAELGRALARYYADEGRTDRIVIYKPAGTYALHICDRPSDVINVLTHNAA